MKWLWLVALPGGSLLLVALAARWLIRRHQAALAQRDAARIKPFVYRPGMRDHDDRLRVNTDRRRLEADARRRQAARIESGVKEQQPAVKIHLVGR